MFQQFLKRFFDVYMYLSWRKIHYPKWFMNVMAFSFWMERAVYISYFFLMSNECFQHCGKLTRSCFTMREKKHFDPLLEEHKAFQQRHHYTPASNVALFLMCISPPFNPVITFCQIFSFTLILIYFYDKIFLFLSLCQSLSSFSFCLSVCQSVCLSVCLSVSLST